MQIQIFDVEHGFCAYVVGDYGNVMLIDCGHNSSTNFYPADYLAQKGCTGIEAFFSLNYDEDHLSGLPRLKQLYERVPVAALYRNRSLSAQQLRSLKLKTGPLGQGMVSLLDMIETYTGELSKPVDYHGIEYATFCNPYPQFDDTNNLSMVLFVHHPCISIVFPGDLEKDGWLELLKIEEFQSHLQRVHVFVASHHGRQSGYMPEVFNYCTPQIVIISDEKIQYDTQEHCYEKHCSGIMDGQGKKYVYSTRKYGMITLIGGQDNKCQIFKEKN